MKKSALAKSVEREKGARGQDEGAKGARHAKSVRWRFDTLAAKRLVHNKRGRKGEVH